MGSFSNKTCLDYGLTGVMSRSVGVKRDLRLSKLETYSNYYYLNFRSFLGQHGDCYDRFLIRMNEMVESLNICNQLIYKITKFNKNNTFNDNKNKNFNISPHHVLKFLDNRSFNRLNSNNNYNTMEDLISHFKYWSEGFVVKPN